jgi:regulatory protein
VRRRKFGSSPPQSLAERAKQARFLQYRGFTSDQIRAALNSDVESDGSATQADAGFDLDLDS